MRAYLLDDGDEGRELVGGDGWEEVVLDLHVDAGRHCAYMHRDRMGLVSRNPFRSTRPHHASCINRSRTQAPEPAVDAKVGGRLDLAHRPGGGLGGGVHAAGREVVHLVIVVVVGGVRG